MPCNTISITIAHLGKALIFRHLELKKVHFSPEALFRELFPVIAIELRSVGAESSDLQTFHHVVEKNNRVFFAFARKAWTVFNHYTVNNFSISLASSEELAFNFSAATVIFHDAKHSVHSWNFVTSV